MNSHTNISLAIRHLGTLDYQTAWQKMSAFTDARPVDTDDELWLLQHPPVFTQGQAGRPEHLLNPRAIPVVQSDRGGQVTYHGPGQLVAYPLINIKRLKLNVRDWVFGIEQVIIDTLRYFEIEGQRREKAPGVYVNDAKIAALGLRVRHGYSFHGLSLNVAMDLEPFNWINPCGYEGLAVTQLADLVDPAPSVDEVASLLSQAFCRYFQFSAHDSFA